jgi:hypothetical protein
MMTSLGHYGHVEHSRDDVTQASQGTPERRELRPFPAIDPEPDHRFQWRTLIRPGIALLAACAVAAAVTGGVRLANAARHPASATAAASAPFTDHDGLIVFEQQPSGLLGTAGPDGSHPVIDKSLGGLQGNDLATASPDGRYLVNQEAQLIRVGARGPTAVTQLAAPDQQAETATNGLEWIAPTFADGSRYLAVTECDPVGQAGFSADEAWASWLIPTGGGKPSSLGLVTASAGRPDSAGVIAALPVSPATARQQVTCDEQESDGSLANLAPGKSPRVILTAAALVKAAGWKPSTPVTLSAYPSPDGSHLLVEMTSNTPRPPGTSGGGVTPGPAPPAAQFLLSPAGRILSELPARTGQLFWSPDGRKAASCDAGQGQQSSVTVLSIAGDRVTPTRTIPLPGHHDAFCDQLLWSPDGTQLIYSAFATSHGLTQADDLQHGWTVIDPATGKVHDVAAPGQPAAWLP